ncbi:hypothetical protein [Acetilactobacillus jinshanensis]|uniref:Uncharacterized protein n=1 Tax=Acetilactobacillus jinshanensis TaxID=1720083 RepID=A0A4V1ALN6_9LACO|nr:hypothetical protein [Acetilactobacillus jinshanensis]QBP18229.1 hypothetical protein ELX58_03560 [Acetilactobacillus jinshanensis]URL61099.1 hypothetical protein HGK75_03635 [uncultured bacterium]
MTENFKCHQLNLGDRVSLQMMSNHLNLTSSIGTSDFALTGTIKAFKQLKNSRGWKQFVDNAEIKAID